MPLVIAGRPQLAKQKFTAMGRGGQGAGEGHLRIVWAMLVEGKALGLAEHPNFCLHIPRPQAGFV